MEAYGEGALQDIEDRYAEKLEAVEDRYEALRTEPADGTTDGQLVSLKTKVGDISSLAGATIGAGLAVAGPVTGNHGLMIAGMAVAGAGFGINISFGEYRLGAARNRALDGAKHVEKGWYNTRERAAKKQANAVYIARQRKVRATERTAEVTEEIASWPGIDRLLGDGE